MSNKLIRVNEQGQKVFEITDPITKETFEHTQVGKGRPPVYSPATRAARQNKGRRNNVVTLSLVARQDLPKAGTKAFFIPVEEFGDWETAVRHMQLVDVAKTRGGKATVILNNKRTTVPLNQLITMDVELQ